MGWLTRSLACAIAATTLVACIEEGAGGIASGTAQFRWRRRDAVMPLQSGVLYEETESGELLVALTSWPNATCSVDEWHEFTSDQEITRLENPYTIVVFPVATLGQDRAIVPMGLSDAYGAILGSEDVWTYLVALDRDAAGGASGLVGFRSPEIPTSSPGVRPGAAVDYPEDPYENLLDVEGSAWFDVPFCGRRHAPEFWWYLQYWRGGE